MLGLNRRSVLKSGIAAAALPWAGRAMADGPSVPSGLVDLAKKEGRINVITLPRDWANWGATMDRFQALYGVKLGRREPRRLLGRGAAGDPQPEEPGARARRGRCRAARSPSPARGRSCSSRTRSRPGAISPTTSKHPGGLWYGDYFGVESFAVNTGVAKTVPQTWADLKKPEYKGMVAMNGNPLGAGRRVRRGVRRRAGQWRQLSTTSSRASSSSAELAKLGNLNPAAATPASLIAGQTPVVINWDYLSLGYKKQAAGKVEIDVLVPKEAPPFGNFYCQAISAYAPHPNTAKLWMEYVYSDEGQLAFLGGFAHPIRFNALVAAGKVPDESAEDAAAGRRLQGHQVRHARPGRQGAEGARRQLAAPRQDLMAAGAAEAAGSSRAGTRVAAPRRLIPYAFIALFLLFSAAFMLAPTAMLAVAGGAGR